MASSRAAPCRRAYSASMRSPDATILAGSRLGAAQGPVLGLVRSVKCLC